MIKARKQLRVPLPLQVKFKREDSNEFELSKIEDISWGGIFLIVDPTPRAGSRLIIQFEFPQENVRLEIWGTVVRVRAKEVGKPAGVGVEFDEVDNDTRSQIQNLVDYWVRELARQHFKK